MESRSPTAGREGDEDAMISVTAALAKDAAALFESRRFWECVEVLHQLLEKKPEDPKVLHNIAVVEYFRDGCSDPRKLLDLLDKVKKKSEDLPPASGEQAEVLSNSGNNASSGSRGINASVHQFSVANTGNVAYTDVFGISVATFNTAVVLYHLQEYARASSVLEPLYQNLEPIDETTALNICLLLLDVALASQDVSKAADVIQYLEKASGFGYAMSQGDNGNAVQHQSSNQGLKASVVTSNMPALDASSSDSGTGANASENALVRTLSDDALEYENLLLTLDNGSQNTGRTGSNDPSKTPADRAAPPAADLKLKLQLYKVRFLLLTRNLKATKREAKLAMNIARGRDSSTALILKSQLEYNRGNHRKAIKLLVTSSNRADAGVLSMLNNNLGCVYFQVGMHHTSIMFFLKALKSSLSIRCEKPLKLSTFSQDKSLLISYNCGLQHLASGKPLVAACCFHKAISIFDKRPLFWLRFAECSLLALEKGLLSTTSRASFSGGEVRVLVVGSGKWRQLLVDDMNSRNSLVGNSGKDGIPFADNVCRLSLPFARQCLLNAWYLLNNFDQKLFKSTTDSISGSREDELNQITSVGGAKKSGDSKVPPHATSVSTPVSVSGDSKESKGVSSNTVFQISVSAYEDICRKESHMIKQAVLGDLAYVELNMGNPLKALSYARELQQLPDCSRIYVFLSRIYAAEALCCLNRPKEAAEQLSVYIMEGDKIEFPYSDEDRDKWRAEKGMDSEEPNGPTNGRNVTEDTERMVFLQPEEARGALCVNLVAMFALRGDLEKASHYAAEAVSSFPDNPRAVLAAVYTDLLQQKVQDALGKLRRYNHVRFVHSALTVKS